MVIELNIPRSSADDIIQLVVVSHYGESLTPPVTPEVNVWGLNSFGGSSYPIKTSWGLLTVLRLVMDTGPILELSDSAVAVVKVVVLSCQGESLSPLMAPDIVVPGQVS